MAKLGRNSPCPCESGKKYKHCCLGKHEAALRAAESYETLKEANVDVDELRKQYDRLSDYEKAGLIGTSSGAFVKFSEIYVRNKLLSLKDLSGLQHALRAIFLRMDMQMQSMAMLASPAHYQATTMIARNLLELGIDLIVLANNPDMLGKYLAFPEVDRFNYARKLANFQNAHSALVTGDYDDAIRWASDPDKIRRIEELRTQHWGLGKNNDPVNPSTWSNLNMADFAAKAGFEMQELYRRIYQPTSWQVHSSPSGHLDLPAGAHYSFHVSAHLNAQEIFERVIRKVDAIFHLADRQKYFDRDLNRAKWQYGAELSKAAEQAAQD